MNSINPDSQLARDLIVRRGGNKARLIARCFIASSPALAADPDNSEQGYAIFREALLKKTFADIHASFDSLLPAEFRY